MSEEQPQHPEEPAESSRESGVETPSNSEEEAQPRTGDAAPPVKEEEVREEDAAPAAGSEASPARKQEEQ